MQTFLQLTFLVSGSKKLTLNWVNKKVTASWNSVFTSLHPLYYEVSAGSVQAGVNIIQWQETNQTSIMFGIPSSVLVKSGLPVHVTVRAVSVGGFTAVKIGNFTLP